jgi:SH3-like domain-containing protein
MKRTITLGAAALIFPIIAVALVAWVNGDKPDRQIEPVQVIVEDPALWADPVEEIETPVEHVVEAPVEVPIEVTRTARTTVWLNLRDAPGMDALIVTTLDPDTTVTLTGDCVSGWCPVDADGTVGFVGESYLTTEENG